jgi:RNA polymerase sigma factor (sigma-70 family)
MARMSPREGNASNSSPLITAEAFAATYLPRVLRFASMVSPPGADPEDVAQDAMVAAITHLDRFDPSRGSMEAWLWRIVLNRGRDAGRVRIRNRLLLDRIGLLQRRELAASASPEALVVDRLRDQELLAAVRRLPARHRTLIALKYGAGLSSSEIGALMHTTSMAVKKAMPRALDRLRADLQSTQGDEGES